jgi:hypothetical protein
MCWWNNVHLTINQQLIAHMRKTPFHKDEKMNLRLKTVGEKTSNGEESTNPISSTLNTGINKSLHIMAAHLHRYRFEISRVEDVLTELSSRYEKYFSFVDSKDDVDESVDRTMQALLQAAQRDARSTQQVAVQSYELAQTTGEDSIAMKAVSSMIHQVAKAKAKNILNKQCTCKSQL